MRAVFALILVIASTAVLSDELRTPVSPVTQKAEGGDKSKNHPQTKEELSVALPSTVDTSVGAKLDMKSENFHSEGHKEPFNWSEVLVAFFTGLLVLVTGYLVFYTKRLWGSTAKLVEDAKDTAKRQLRAYLGMSKCGVVTITKKHIQAFVEIKNTGQTPAHKVIQTIKAEIRDSKSGGGFPLQNTDRGSTVIVPGSHITIRFDLLTTEPIIKEIIDGTKTIVVWGSVSYIDIFDNRQRLEFCFSDLAEIYESPNGVTEFLVGWELQPVEDGNKST